jgi:hypothetical protein
MSAFLGFESFLIPSGSTVQNVQDTLKTAITSYGWQCIKQSLVPVATLGTFTSPGNVFDGDNTTTVTETSSLPKWVGVQLANPFTPTNLIIQISSSPSAAPKDFTLDWSDDGTTWTTHQTWTGENNWLVISEVRSFAVTGAPAKSYWRLNVTARVSGTVTTISNIWLEDSSNNQVSTNMYGFFIPPVTETIGNSVSRELVKISCNSSAISIVPIQELLTAMPQCNSFYAATSGAVTLSITINNVTVSYTGIAGNTAVQNARGLFEAVSTSTDANFLAWEWKWTSSLLGLSNYSYFLATKKIPANNITITTSNITTITKSVYAQPQIQRTGVTRSYTMTIDLLNGFIYYLQVCSRGIALAIKTNAGFYGPCHACYGNNAEALVQMPANDHTLLPVTPIELVVGYDDIATNTGGYGKITHWWVVYPDYGNRFGVLNPETDYQSCNVFTKHGISGYVSDTMGNVSSFADINITMKSEGLFSDGDNGNMYTIHRLTMNSDTTWTYTLTMGANGRGIVPELTNLDWYRYVGTLANEQLVLAASTDFTTTITSTASATDDTLTVASTTGFPATGYIVADGEVIQYTGTTPTSFTGCTRGKYATNPVSQLNGTTVNVAMWLVKINTGLLLAGYQKPV